MIFSYTSETFSPNHTSNQARQDLQHYTAFDTRTMTSTSTSKELTFDVHAYQMSLIPNGAWKSLTRDVAKLYLAIFTIQLCVAGYCVFIRC